MEIVQALNPGQPPLPDWVYNGAILGVQGQMTIESLFTLRMLLAVDPFFISYRFQK